MKVKIRGMRRLGIHGIGMLEILNSCSCPEMAVTGSDGSMYTVKTRSTRYKLFQLNRKCVCCGIEGCLLALEVPIASPTHPPHFNMYALRGDNLILMTKDHIKPKSKNGGDGLANMQTMCCICNSAKKDNELTIDELRQHIIHELSVK